MPLVVTAFQHIELNEGAGLPVHFPGRSRLAGAQADDGIADTHGLAGLHGKLARDSVALVQQADLGSALGHRRTGQAVVDLNGAFVPAAFFLHAIAGILGAFRLAARAKQGNKAEREQPPARHGGPGSRHASGAQAS